MASLYLLYVLYLVLTMTLRAGYPHYTHFIDGETEVWRVAQGHTAVSG